MLTDLDDLRQAHAGRSGPGLLRPLIGNAFRRRIALVSSFGAESAVLLHMVAEIDPATPVIFIDTGRLFPETLAYRHHLARRLGLRDLRVVGPEAEEVRRFDPYLGLWADNPDLCCHVRKVVPLERALAGFDAWISGRKRHQTPGRARLEPIELADGRVKVNPLFDWDAEDVEAYFARHDLPRHPLVAEGFPSIGCVSCTHRVAAGDDPRSGRWAGTGKTECGIHFGADGRAVRGAGP